MTSDAFAPAKINLTLHVTGQRDDGYHLLDSLVMFADIGDRLTFTPASHTSLKVTGPFAEGVPTDYRNTVHVAADMAGAHHAITLEKNLPHGAGIGGGSSDAAAVLRHFDCPADGARIGADVPVCLRGTAQRMQGIGGILTPLDGFPPLAAVLVNPGVHVPTPRVFQALTDKSNNPMPQPLPKLSTPSATIQWLAEMRNDLEPSACRLAPVIQDVLAELSAFSPLVRMSGSGATCFALFESTPQAEHAAAVLANAQPQWWIRATTLS